MAAFRNILAHVLHRSTQSVRVGGRQTEWKYSEDEEGCLSASGVI